MVTVSGLIGLLLPVPATAAAAGGAAESGSSPPAETSTILPPLVVTASRRAQTPEQTIASVDVFAGAELAEAPALMVDDTLRGSAAFSLFRRTSSLFANPTAQGVSLRGLGPSGASRSLVLLDGIPLNDPFGGWVAWTKIPRLTLRRAEIVRGGGSSVWGNAALGGTVQLLAPAPAATAGALTLDIGTLDTLRTEFVATTEVGERSRVQWGGRWFQTDGAFQYSRAQRGSIDRRFDSEHAVGHVSFHTETKSGLHLSLGARGFDEERGNGTPYQRNDSRENSVHARVVGELRPDVGIDVLAYAQRQHFASGFSSVDVARATETPALDQFDVPATAWGGALVFNFEHAAAATAWGADVRAVSGETREDFFFDDGEFLRRRHAGGEQLTGGMFVSHQRTLAPEFDAQVAARVDRWQNRDGNRREWTKATGAVLRDEAFADTSGTEFNPSAGIIWRPLDGMSWRTSIYRAFRVPTLNELYRPFRVGNVVTEANPALERETVTGVESGVTYEMGAWRARATLFQNDLHDGIANVTLTSTPTLTQRQRRNLESIRVRGLEAGLEWMWGRQLELALDYLWTDARVRRATIAPTLEGRRLAQVPRHTATLRLHWSPHEVWRVDAAVRAISAQFEDDENALPLAAAITADVAVRRAVGPRHEWHLAVENLFNTYVETGRTAAGLFSRGPGRLARTGWSMRW